MLPTVESDAAVTTARYARGRLFRPYLRCLSLATTTRIGLSAELTPREMRLGVRVLISREAAARWRSEREAASGS